MNETIRWGIIGVGDVTEVKSGPGFQQAEHSELVAVMRRDGDKAKDYAERHGVAALVRRRRGADRRPGRGRRLRRHPAGFASALHEAGGSGRQTRLGREADGAQLCRVPADDRRLPAGECAAVGRLLSPPPTPLRRNQAAGRCGNHWRNPYSFGHVAPAPAANHRRSALAGAARDLRRWAVRRRRRSHAGLSGLSARTNSGDARVRRQSGGTLSRRG